MTTSTTSTSGTAGPARTARPAIDGWFETDPEPALLAARCTSCGGVNFPPTVAYCPDPRCSGVDFETFRLSRRGRIWSYTDSQYQPPAPYIAPTPFVPYAIAAVELDQGLIVLGRLTAGVGCDHVAVGDEVQLDVETLYTDDEGERTIWCWTPVTP